MRHRKQNIKFGRRTSHRKATSISLVSSLIRYQRIQTTLTKAKETSRLADRLITLAKDGSVHHRRKAYSILGDRDLVRILFAELAPLFSNRQGGYTRVIPTRTRAGDGASLAQLEWTQTKPVEKKTKKKPASEAKKAKEALAEKPKDVKEPTKAMVAEKEKMEEIPPQPPPPKQKKVPPKEEEKGFLGGLRKLFGKRGK